jgi:hypothetical protein
MSWRIHASNAEGFLRRRHHGARLRSELLTRREDDTGDGKGRAWRTSTFMAQNLSLDPAEE